MRALHNIAVTGGAGFIGSHFIRYIFQQPHFKGIVVNIDKLTYAGNRKNLQDIEERHADRYFFEKYDICDYNNIKTLFDKYQIDTVVHFAAESHVDRAIDDAQNFIHTNIIGTFTLLEVSRIFWETKTNVLFHHISTDEVFGSMDSGYFYEDTRYNPRNPYAASKASADHLVRSYFHTHNLPITLSHCSNNFGSYQYAEKFIPVIIGKLQAGENIPVYGDGQNVREWIYVEDHCAAIWEIMNRGQTGETYNIGSSNECSNIDLVQLICAVFAQIKRQPLENFTKYITFVTDRKGHDRRYALNCDKIIRELGWQAKHTFADAIFHTVKWYLRNKYC